MIKYLLILFILFASPACENSSDAHLSSESLKMEKSKIIDNLANEFINPPMSSRPGAYWCWLNGDVTKASITKDLEEMKAKGMARAEIWDVEARKILMGLLELDQNFSVMSQ